MSFSFLPGMIVSSVTELTAPMLAAHNIRLLMLDFDNTIVPYTTDVPTPQMERWLKSMAASDIDICVVSNSKKPRVRVFCEKYGIACITHARKPFSDGIRACLTRFSVPPDRAALAGDQIYTDTLGANCCGVTSVLVSAIDNHNFWLKARHVLELPFIFAARKRRVHL